MNRRSIRIAAMFVLATAALPLQARPPLGLTGAWSFKLTTLAGQSTLLDGGGTRLVVPLGDGALYLGAGGYTSHEGPRLGGDLLGCMYGGLWGEYDFVPRRLVHLSLGLLAGGGMVGRMDEATGAMSASPMLVLEPELSVSLNLTSFLRLAAGLSYRLAVPFREVPGLGLARASAPALTLQLRPIAP